MSLEVDVGAVPYTFVSDVPVEVLIVVINENENIGGGAEVAVTPVVGTTAQFRTLLAEDGNIVITQTVNNITIGLGTSIPFTKMAPLTANRALETDSSGLVIPSIITSTELGFLDNLTSNIQTQIDGKPDLPIRREDTITSIEDGGSPVATYNIDLSSSATHTTEITLTGDLIITFSNGPVGVAEFDIILIQDGVGGHAVDFDIIPVSSQPIINLDAGTTTILDCHVSVSGTRIEVIGNPPSASFLTFALSVLNPDSLVSTGTVQPIGTAVGSVIEIGGLDYTAVAGVPASDGEFQVGATDNDTATNLGDVVTNDTRTSPFGLMRTVLDQVVLNVITFKASISGVNGDVLSIREQSPFTGGFVTSGQTLVGGQDYIPFAVGSRNYAFGTSLIVTPPDNTIVNYGQNFTIRKIAVSAWIDTADVAPTCDVRGGTTIPGTEISLPISGAPVSDIMDVDIFIDQEDFFSGTYFIQGHYDISMSFNTVLIWNHTILVEF